MVKNRLTPPLHDPERLRHKGAVVQWRTSLARQRRAPAGFIRPCQPVIATKVPMGEGWIHELKWDGYRVIVRRNEGVVRLWSRHARSWNKEFPRIVEAVRALPFENFTLDGEAVCLLGDGRPDFHALRSKHTCQDAILVAFDLLGMDGADLRGLPLHERRRRLAAILSAGPDALLFSSNVEAGEGEALFRHACAMNLEGIVSKRIDSSYRSGLSQAWRKIKCPGYRRP